MLLRKLRLSNPCTNWDDALASAHCQDGIICRSRASTAVAQSTRTNVQFWRDSRRVVRTLPRKGNAMYGSKTIIVAGLALCAASGSQAQQPTPPQLPQSPSMTFFVTSVGPGKGADLGGLEGADRHCQQLAERHGAGGKPWRAYLSTQAAGANQAVNARDRIGNGPWQNFKGETVAQSNEDLHSDS